MAEKIKSSALDKLQAGAGETVAEVEENNPSSNIPTIELTVEIIDFPTPYYHSANPDGTRNVVMFSELQEYINSLK